MIEAVMAQKKPVFDCDGAGTAEEFGVTVSGSGCSGAAGGRNTGDGHLALASGHATGGAGQVSVANCSLLA